MQQSPLSAHSPTRLYRSNIPLACAPNPNLLQSYSPEQFVSSPPPNSPIVQSAFVPSAAFVMSGSLPPGLPLEEIRSRLYATVAPLAEKIVSTARFAVGDGRNTTLNYHEQDKEKQVTQQPSDNSTADPHGPPDAQDDVHKEGAAPAGLGGMDGVGVRTAPTVYITSTTASSEVSAFPLITVGPIIGLTTDTTTRILIEANTTMTVQVRLRMVERNVRLTRGNKRLHDQGKANSMLNTTTGIVHSPKPQPTTSEHTSHPSTTATSSTSSHASTNGHSTASHPQPAHPSTADFSRTAVTSTSLAQLTPRHPTAASSSTPLSPEDTDGGSTGTTIGTETSIGITSTEQQPAPATRPSPVEQPQVERDIDPSKADNGDGSYVHSPLSRMVEQGGAHALFDKDESKPGVTGSEDGQSLAEPVDDGHVIEKDVECTAHRVSVATFTDLTPDCRYEITFHNIRSRVTSTVTTLLTGWQVSSLTLLDVAFVSCNLLSVTKDLALPESDLWLDLRRRVAEHEVDYVCHIGDQIYGTSKQATQHMATNRCCCHLN